MRNGKSFGFRGEIQKYPGELAAKPCICFFIPDDYEYMDSNLVDILREKMREHFPPTG